MKTVLINGSPRKNWNTHKLLMEAERGAMEAGAVTETVHLYDLDYKGCISCFACKLKENKTQGICAIRDGLRPVLESIAGADALIIGSPIYYSNLTAQTLAFIERLLFAMMYYEYGENGRPIRATSKIINCGFILTMNVPEEGLEAGYGKKFSEFADMVRWILSGGEEPLSGGDCPIVYSCDTYQFSDYNKYRASMFDPVKKAAHREKQFPVDLKNAYDLGRKLSL